MPAKFAEKVSDFSQHQAWRGLMIRPRLNRMPLPMQRFDDPFLPFGKAIIDATHALTNVYVFDFACYLAIGAAGIVALERTIAYVMARNEAITVLHVPLASADYVAAMSDNALNVDAVTVVNPLVAQAYASAGFGVFLTIGNQPPYGTFDEQRGVMTVPDAITFKVFGDDVLYADGGEGFAEAARRKLEGSI